MKQPSPSPHPFLIALPWACTIPISTMQVEVMDVRRPRNGAVYWEGPVNVSLEVTLAGEKSVSSVCCVFGVFCYRLLGGSCLFLGVWDGVHFCPPTMRHANSAEDLLREPEPVCRTVVQRTFPEVETPGAEEVGSIELIAKLPCRETPSRCSIPQ